jgi:hypothetical protein
MPLLLVMLLLLLVELPLLLSCLLSLCGCPPIAPSLSASAPALQSSRTICLRMVDKEDSATWQGDGIIFTLCLMRMVVAVLQES